MEAARAAAEAALRALPFPLSQSRPNVQRAGEHVTGMCLGAVSARGRGIVPSAHTQQHADVVEKLVRWAAAALPASFAYTSIQINKDYAAALHLDANNAGPSYIVGAGDFRGGQLWVHQQRYGGRPWEPPISGAPAVLDVAGATWHEFDGNMPHCTLPFTGTRYTAIYFTQQSHHLMAEADRALLRRLGFPLPSSDRDNHQRQQYPRRADRLEAGQEAYRQWRQQQPQQLPPLPTHEEIMAVEIPAGGDHRRGSSGVEVLLDARELARLRGHKKRPASPGDDEESVLRTRRRRRMRITLLDGDQQHSDKFAVRVGGGVSAEEVAAWVATSPPPPPPRPPRARRIDVDLSIGAPTDILRVGDGLCRVRTAYRIERTRALDGKTVAEALRTLVPDKRGGVSLFTRVDMRYDLAREVLVLEEAAAVMPPP